MRKKKFAQRAPRKLFKKKKTFKVPLSAVPRNKKRILPLTACWWLHGGGNGGGGGHVADHRMEAAEITAVLPPPKKKRGCFTVNSQKLSGGKGCRRGWRSPLS